jgi:hypothetical protein
MLSSTVLEVAIGLVFCFGSVAIVASSIYEAVASILKLRANTLLQGVKDLLNNQGPLILGIYNHALVNPRSNGQTTAGDPKVRPSYIDPKNFALAFVETLQGAPATFQELRVKIDAVTDKQLHTFLIGAYDRAGNDIANFQRELASWFDDGMQRVSGVYKRTSQLWTVFIALVVAGLFNIDTIHLFGALWQHPALVSEIGASGVPDPQRAMSQLQTLPIGWFDESGAVKPLTLLMVVGWAVTSLSSLFGAPFWFDSLQRLVNLRGTGQKPGEKRKSA